MVTLADRPTHPTVSWNGKCDVPLEHCLKELPLPTEGAAAEAKATAEAEAAADAKPAGHAIGGSDPQQHQQHQQTLQPSTWLTGGVSSLPLLGTRQVAVWNKNWHREANAKAVKEWQAAVDVGVYTAAPQMARECPEIKRA